MMSDKNWSLQESKIIFCSTPTKVNTNNLFNKKLPFVNNLNILKVKEEKEKLGQKYIFFKLSQ